MFLDLILVLSLFIAPLTLPSGSVRHLDARANAMDHTDRWREMEVFPMVVYTFGDMNCHQRESRSLILNGNQLPVCARDVSIFTGLLLGAALLIRARANDSPSLVFISILPRRLRRVGFVRKHPALTFTAFFLLLLVPTAMDGGIQLISEMGGILPFSYESTNPTRILTGFPMGVGVGILLTSLFMTLLSRRDDESLSLASFFFK
jgi:uncharacterized membrane protein